MPFARETNIFLTNKKEVICAVIYVLIIFSGTSGFATVSIQHPGTTIRICYKCYQY